MAGDCLNLHSLINNEIKNYFIHEFPFVFFFPCELSIHVLPFFFPVGLSFLCIWRSSVFVLGINPLAGKPTASISRSVGAFHLPRSFDVCPF